MSSQNVRAMSFGGGVQSTAMLVLAANGAIDCSIALFANVGADSENPATIAYVDQFARPFAERHNIEFVTLDRVRRDGSTETLLQRIERSERSIPIPVRMSGGAPGNRQCTGDFKIKVVAKELKRRGATRDNPAVVALGISMDEYQRMRTESSIPYETLWYPLIDLRLTREDCKRIIVEAGLPIPPKSSCFFCPFHNIGEWRRLRRDEPDLFAEAVRIETLLNERREMLGRDRVFMTSALKPLLEATDLHGQLEMAIDGDDDGRCDKAGYCMI